jgi:hypothetical protein
MRILPCCGQEVAHEEIIIPWKLGSVHVLAKHSSRTLGGMGTQVIHPPTCKCKEELVSLALLFKKPVNGGQDVLAGGCLVALQVNENPAVSTITRALNDTVSYLTG